MSIPVLFPFLNPIVVVYFLMLSCVSSLYIWDTNPYSEIYCFSSVQSLSCVWLFATLHRTPGFHVHHQLPGLTQTQVHLVRDTIQPCHPLLSHSPPAPNPSQHQSLFQWVKSSHEVAKVLEFQLNISPSNEHPGLISFRVDWLDLLAVQGTQYKSPTPQFKSINSLALSFLYSPTLTSIYGYWKNRIFD